MKTTLLVALALIPLALVPAASAGPYVCLGTGCPGAVGMCLDEPGLGDPAAFADCAGVPSLDCPAVYYEVDLGVATVGYGPCTNVDASVGGRPILP